MRPLCRGLVLALVVLALTAGCDREPADEGGGFKAKGAVSPAPTDMPTAPPVPTAPDRVQTFDQVTMPDVSTPAVWSLVGARADDGLLLQATLGDLVTGQTISGLVGGEVVPGGVFDEAVIDDTRVALRVGEAGIFIALQSAPGALTPFAEQDLASDLGPDHGMFLVGDDASAAVLAPRGPMASTLETLARGEALAAPAVARSAGFEEASLWLRVPDLAVPVDGGELHGELLEVALFTEPDIRLVARLTGAAPGAREQVELLVDEARTWLTTKGLATMTGSGMSMAEYGEDLTTLSALLRSAKVTGAGDAVVVTLIDGGGQAQVERWTRLAVRLFLAQRDEVTAQALVVYTLSAARAEGMPRPTDRVEAVDWFEQVIGAPAPDELRESLSDPWGQPLVVEPVGDDQIRACSPGRDGKLDSPDDLCVVESY